MLGTYFMMTLDLKTDGHVHTRYCHHAVGEMEEYVLAAIDRGLHRIIFLEHFEAAIHYFETTWLTAADFEVYFATGLALRGKYQGQIEVGLGVEVGYNPEHIGETLSFLQRYKWDRIGLSYHFMGHDGRHLNMLSRKKENLDEFSRLGVADVVSAYLNGLNEAVKSLPVTVLCHLDAALRHHPEIYFNAGHRRQMSGILEELARRGIALEINTSGFAHRRAEPYPPSWLIKEAVDLGISLVVGSDAHRPQEVGRYFDQLPLLMWERENLSVNR